MTLQATGLFKITSWDEKPFAEVAGGGKLTRASVIKTYTGEIQGTGTLEYLMAYRLDGNADFFGYERFIGQIGERTGSFVLQHQGVFRGWQGTRNFGSDGRFGDRRTGGFKRQK